MLLTALFAPRCQYHSVSNPAPELNNSVLDPERDGVDWLNATQDVPLPEPPEQLEVLHDPVFLVF